MSDIIAESKVEAERLAQPAANEAEILGSDTVSGEVLKDVKKEEKKVVEEEKKEELPKLSAAEFRAYNSMAEHMEYFVSSHLSPSIRMILI
jgi:hypothetical protein